MTGSKESTKAVRIFLSVQVQGHKDGSKGIYEMSINHIVIRMLIRGKRKEKKVVTAQNPKDYLQLTLGITKDYQAEGFVPHGGKLYVLVYFNETCAQ